MLYEQLFKSLHTHHIRYLIVGAVAVNLHGIPRMTADLDVMMDLDEENVRRFIEMITGLGYNHVFSCTHSTSLTRRNAVSGERPSP
jgi:hypothetical protein